LELDMMVNLPERLERMRWRGPRDIDDGGAEARVSIDSAPGGPRAG
jgi:hypothetical protein